MPEVNATVPRLPSGSILGLDVPKVISGWGLATILEFLGIEVEELVGLGKEAVAAMAVDRLRAWTAGRADNVAHGLVSDGWITTTLSRAVVANAKSDVAHKGAPYAAVDDAVFRVFKQAPGRVSDGLRDWLEPYIVPDVMAKLDPATATAMDVAVAVTDEIYLEGERLIYRLARGDD